jgi:general secretion pathway protein B
MSYILDALTKAAQQRDRQAPVVQRLLSPAPRPRSSWHYASRRLLAALALNAVLLAAVLFWWLRPAAVTAPSEPIAAAPESIATPAPPVASPRPLVKLEPLPSAETKVEKLAPSRQEPRQEPSAAAVPPPAAPPVAITPAPAPSAPASPRPRSGTPTIQATPAPAPAPRPPASPETASLRLEALIYADAPAERMVFINGRRYREGDSIEGRLRIEEIREEGVELSDQGRRFTLRVAR